MQCLEFFGILTAYDDSFGFRCFRGQAEKQVTEHGAISVTRDKIVFTPCDDGQSTDKSIHPTVIFPHSSKAIIISDEIKDFGEYTVTVYGNQDDRAELCSLRTVDRDSSSRFKRIMTMFLCDNGYVKNKNGAYLAPNFPVPKKRKFYRSLIGK